MLSGGDDRAVMAVGSRVTHSVPMPRDAYSILGVRRVQYNASDELRESDTRLSGKSSEEHGVVDSSPNARDGLVPRCLMSPLLHGLIPSQRNV